MRGPFYAHSQPPLHDYCICNKYQKLVLRDLDGVSLFGSLEPRLGKEGAYSPELDTKLREEREKCAQVSQDHFWGSQNFTSKLPHSHLMKNRA